MVGTQLDYNQICLHPMYKRLCIPTSGPVSSFNLRQELLGNSSHQNYATNRDSQGCTAHLKI